jgi:hypothetical protein
MFNITEFKTRQGGKRQHAVTVPESVKYPFDFLHSLADYYGIQILEVYLFRSIKICVSNISTTYDCYATVGDPRLVMHTSRCGESAKQ